MPSLKLGKFYQQGGEKKPGGAAMQHESAAGSRAKSNRLKHWLWKWPRKMQLFNFNKSWNTFWVSLTSRTATGCCNANISKFKPFLSCTQAMSSMSRWCKTYVFHSIQNSDLLEIHLTSSNLILCLLDGITWLNTTDTKWPQLSTKTIITVNPP